MPNKSLSFMQNIIIAVFMARCSFDRGLCIFFKEIKSKTFDYWLILRLLSDWCCLHHELFIVQWKQGFTLRIGFRLIDICEFLFRHKANAYEWIAGAIRVKWFQVSCVNYLNLYSFRK